MITHKNEISFLFYWRNALMYNLSSYNYIKINFIVVYKIVSSQIFAWFCTFLSYGKKYYPLK
jgi:hypothetical protein